MFQPSRREYASYQPKRDKITHGMIWWGILHRIYFSLFPFILLGPHLVTAMDHGVRLVFFPPFLVSSFSFSLLGLWLSFVSLLIPTPAHISLPQPQQLTSLFPKRSLVTITTTPISPTILNPKP